MGWERLKLYIKINLPARSSAALNSGSRFALRENAKMPRAVHGDEWPIWGSGGMIPQGLCRPVLGVLYSAFGVLLILLELARMAI
jgi:hypothetical protein